MNNNLINFERMSAYYVPEFGKADTLGGEILRVCNKICDDVIENHRCIGLGSPVLMDRVWLEKALTKYCREPQIFTKFAGSDDIKEFASRIIYLVEHSRLFEKKNIQDSTNPSTWESFTVSGRAPRKCFCTRGSAIATFDEPPFLNSGITPFLDTIR